MQRNKISFKGQKIYIGIDVHKVNWEVFCLTESGANTRHSQKPSAKDRDQSLAHAPKHPTQDIARP